MTNENSTEKLQQYEELEKENYLKPSNISDTLILVILVSTAKSLKFG